MKAPNVLSLIAMLVVVLPSVAYAITQQFPEGEYWWAALITGVIGAAVKALQVYLAGQSAPPPNVAMSDAPQKRNGFFEALLTK